MTDPILVYDDDCGFCTWTADLLADHAEVELVGFSALSDDLLARLPDDYEDCAHFVTEDAVYSCGEAVEKAVVGSEFGAQVQPIVEFARNFEEYDTLRERGYRLVADNRGRLGAVVSKDPPARNENR